MKILGIDPSLRSTGYAILKKHNNITTYIDGGLVKTKSLDIAGSLAEIVDNIDNIVVNFNPELVVMEKIFINKNPLSSIHLSYARGVILSVIGKYNLSLQEFAPNFIKKSIAGSGSATKDQMVRMINLLLPGYNFTDHDHVDAVACAYLGK